MPLLRTHICPKLIGTDGCAKILPCDPEYSFAALNKSFLAAKPNGFWYGIDDAWVKFDGPKADERFEYLVDLGATRVRTLGSLEDVRAFTERFCAPGSGINWREALAETAGVELTPAAYDSAIKGRISWCGMWHCASGVIWRPTDDAVLTFRRVIPAGKL
jgi:hypothetical protein